MRQEKEAGGRIGNLAEHFVKRQPGRLMSPVHVLAQRPETELECKRGERPCDQSDDTSTLDLGKGTSLHTDGVYGSKVVRNESEESSRLEENLNLRSALAAVLLPHTSRPIP